MAARCESLLLLSLSMLLSVGKKRTSLSVYFDSFLSSFVMLGARGAARLCRHCRARRRRTELVCTIGHCAIHISRHLYNSLENLCKLCHSLWRKGFFFGIQEAWCPSRSPSLHLYTLQKARCRRWQSQPWMQLQQTLFGTPYMLALVRTILLSFYCLYRHLVQTDSVFKYCKKKVKSGPPTFAKINRHTKTLNH